ncbi:hypothetical protein MIR68_007933 [Amoeboaphelidium protococcarum]|nr:hypothetical protein MIR68_007933 [Amoeboaphelidium protococcarum]KAI3642916.1 hypothetical protein MP228_012471 [Amoeboaphelidium protococcarum]KAI3654504.1 hypothetical protein MP228_000558 [Amoeboaphelidium protococcarum]
MIFWISKRLLSTQQESGSIIHKVPSMVHRHASHPHTLVSRFAATLTKTGDKRSLVERSVADSLQLLRSKTNNDPVKLFEKAIEMLSPVVECGSYKRGAKLVRVPLPITEYRSQSYAFRWLKKSLSKKKRPFIPLEERICSEILAILEGKSPLLQRKVEMHREALNNRAFAHLRWAVGYRM